MGLALLRGGNVDSIRKDVPSKLRENEDFNFAVVVNGTELLQTFVSIFADDLDLAKSFIGDKAEGLLIGVGGQGADVIEIVMKNVAGNVEEGSVDLDLLNAKALMAVVDVGFVGEGFVGQTVESEEGEEFVLRRLKLARGVQAM